MLCNSYEVLCSKNWPGVKRARSAVSWTPGRPAGDPPLLTLCRTSYCLRDKRYEKSDFGGFFVEERNKCAHSA